MKTEFRVARLCKQYARQNALSMLPMGVSVELLGIYANR